MAIMIMQMTEFIKGEKRIMGKKRIHKKFLKVMKGGVNVLRLDLGCGDNKREGFKGVDRVKTASTDYVHDLLEFPWPFKDASVDEAHCSHFFEHIPGMLRGKFMDELYRVLKFEAKARFIVPYWSSKRSVQDFTHTWPPVCEDSFLYFNKGFRDGNKLTHGYYDLKCDFDFQWGFVVDQGLTVRSEEYRQHAMLHDINVVNDLDLTIIKAIREPIKK